MSNYKQIAQETLRIIKDGYYILDGKQIDVCGYGYETTDIAEVLDARKLQSIVDDEDETFEKAFFGCANPKMYLINDDSFAVAKKFVDLRSKTLVMNFANAITPGGGFEYGVNAQEQALCRNSTLYASISSTSASSMYNHNKKINSPIDSDYMIFSDYVLVFRDKLGDLLNFPYELGVVSLPAPNKNGRARDVAQSEMDKVMIDRLVKLFYAAAYKGYRSIVLGAWGCGAFGHDTKTVAGYFYHLLVKREFNQFFDNIVFAIFKDEKKIDIFREVFRGELL